MSKMIGMVSKYTKNTYKNNNAALFDYTSESISNALAANSYQTTSVVLQFPVIIHHGIKLNLKRKN